MSAHDLIYDIREKLPSFISQSFKNHPYFIKLKSILESDLNFHNAPNNSLTHNFHSFPAKFPPPLPQLFIKELTIPHEVIGKFGAAEVLLKPASPGTGVIASGGIRILLELAGIHDILTKSLGSHNSQNSVKAALQGITQLRNPEMVARMRGVELATLRG